MRKLILVTLLLLLITPCLEAQRKELSQARSYIKSGKDYDKAEKLMTDLLAKDSINRQNPKIYLLLYQAQKKQYETGNEKLYTKQKYDTASLFNLTKKMYATLVALDSIDSRPDNKGRVRPEYRKKHAEEFNLYRPNLFFGGTYYVRKNDFSTAYAFFEDYIDCARQPMFDGYNYDTTDVRMYSAAYWATMCGHRLSNPMLTLKYSSLAQKDTAHLSRTLRFMADAYDVDKDTSSYVRTLHEGFQRFPKYTYFFPKLIDYYTTSNKLDSALALADSALAIDGRDELFLFAKSTVLLGMGRNDECITVSDSLIAINDTMPEAYYNAGMAYLNKALAMEEKLDVRKNKKSMQTLYRKAQPYMERYRELAPTEKKKWASALYRIYLNLNLGKQFEEIDKLLNS